MKIYDTIIVGAGAAGLYCAARLNRTGRGTAACSTPSGAAPASGVLLLEKTNQIGNKLLMSGAGQCNLTHGGSIKDFLTCYGDKGSRIRTTLYAHNNLAVCDFFASLSVTTVEREDGKIFPSSMDAHQVRDALHDAAEKNGVQLQTGADVTAVRVSEDASGSLHYQVTDSLGRNWQCRNLVIATGGCSYPSTGSDGSIFQILQRDLSMEIVQPVPALTPVFVENYPFAELSGISFQGVEVTISEAPSSAAIKPDSSTQATVASSKQPAPRGVIRVTGDLLLTHRNLSGPVILNHSRYMKTGTRLAINYVFPYTTDSILAQMKKEFPANHRTIEHWMAEKYALPKRFCEVVVKETGVACRRVSALSGGDMKTLAAKLTADTYVISGLGSFRQAMVTAGGVALGEISLKTMESKKHPGLFFIGEVLDVDGDTGGYNLQFAFASAAAAAKAICG